jgi:hypothetical protein
VVVDVVVAVAAGASRQELSLSTIVRCYPGKVKSGRTRLCSIMVVMVVFLSGLA